MPIYEYECSTCAHRFEKMVKIGADIPPCPDCASAEVRKRISASAFILKGGGWYKDHYGLKGGSDGAKDGAKASDSAPAKSEGAGKAEGAGDASSSKTDAASKPEAKPTTDAKPASTPTAAAK